MRSRGELLRSLRAAKRDAARSAAEKALASEDVCAEVDRIEHYDKLIGAVQNPSRSNWGPAVATGFICLAIASVAWIARISSVNIYVAVETDAVEIQLARDWQSRSAWPLGADPFRLAGLAEIWLPPEFAPDSKLEGNAWLDVEKAQITLSNLEFSTASKISVLQPSPSATYLLSVGAPMRGQIQVRGAASVRGGNGNSAPTLSKAINFEVPAAFPFYDDGSSLLPMQLRFSTVTKLVLRDLPISKLSFSREASGAAVPPVFVSGISSGTIDIRESGEKITLSESDRVQLGPTEGTIRELEIGPKTIRLTFEGKSKSVSVGAAGFEQNKVPTFLAYLYHQERLGFFWGSVVFLWSVLWSARQFLHR